MPHQPPSYSFVIVRMPPPPRPDWGVDFDLQSLYGEVKFVKIKD